MKVKQLFSIQDEKQFLENETALNARYISKVYGVFILLYAFFGLADLYYYPNDLVTLFIIRFAIVIPVLFMTIFLSMNQKLKKYHQYFVAFSFFIGGSGIAYMVILYPENVVYYGGLFMIYFSGYLIIRLRFIYATIAGLAVLVFHFIGYWLVQNDFSQTFLFGMLFYVGANIIGIIGSYQFERQNRSQFLHDIIIQKISNELKENYKEKVDQFNRLEQSIKENTHLIEKNEELARLTKSLNESENRFRTLFDHAPLGYQSLDIDGCFREVNQTWLELFGYKLEEVVGKWFGDFLTPNAKILFKERFEIFKKQGKIHSEFEMLKKNGEVVYAEFEGLIGYDEHNQFLQTYCILNDVTERKKIERQLKLNMDDLVKSQEIAKVGTWRLDIDTNEVVWSQELYRMYGFDPTQPIPPYTEHMKLFTPASWAMLSKALSITRTKGIPYELELEMVTKDGIQRWMWVRGEAEKDVHGKIIAITGVAQDITNRVMQHRNLEISEQRFRETVHNIDAGIVIHATDSTVIDCNERATELLGLSKAAIMGKADIDTDWKFVNEDKTILPIDEYPINQILKTKIPFKDRILGVVHSTNKAIVWVKVNGTLIQDGDGNISEILINFTDITDLKNSHDLISKNEKQYRLLTTEMQLGLALHEIICDDQGSPIDYRFITINPAYEVLTGLIGDEIIGKTVKEILPNIETYWIETFGEVALHGKSIMYENYSSELKKYYRVSAYSPDKGYFAVIVEDITQQRNIEIQQEYLRTHDHLTGLKNRIHFNEQLFKLDFEASLPISVISFDINGLIIINEAFGYEFGNQFIQHVADLLKSVFSEDSIIARVGGDQFAVALKNTTKETADAKARQVVKGVNDYKINETQLSISYGIATKTKPEDDINKLFMMSENAMYSNKIFASQSYRNQSIKSIIKVYHEKNPREEEHSHRVSALCEQFGRVLGLSDDDINKLKAISHLHDIGKIAIDEAILNKTDKLTNEEWEIIKKHPEIGARIISTSDEYAVIADDILAHHERFDGKGYPFGVSGKDIPLRARIISIIDAYDAMTSDRPYRKALTQKETVEELLRCSGSQFDPDLVLVYVKDIIGNSL
jgi:diguanylate cyclase (GGDEF)-like protein/PAS domain S-box-containing protein